MTEQRTIADLRDILFSTIEGVKAGTMPLDKAKVISDLSQVMVNSAKIEVDFIKATKATGSTFLEPAKPLPPGILSVTTHKIRG